jgi:hypothetical protein
LCLLLVLLCAPRAFAVSSEFDLAALLAYLDSSGASAGIADRVNAIAHTICDDGTEGHYLTPTVFNDLRPEYVDWSSDSLNGVPIGNGGTEYQELYRMEVPDTVWTQRATYFDGRGFLVNRDGITPENDVWAPGMGGYSMCHNGDRWMAIQKQSILDRLPAYTDVSQDKQGARFHRDQGARGPH